jgi:thymidylate synthase
MMNTKRAESLDEVQLWVLSSLFKEGHETKPRGLETLELFPVSFTLTKPRNRCVANPERRWNMPLAIGEFCWHVSGSNELQFIEYYAKRWREFAEDGSTIRGSCYGHRIFSRSSDGRSQWQQIGELLRTDPQSRRAVLNFQERMEDLVTDKDVPCANTMQFLVRNSRLHAIVSMRSNDAIWGLPYDVFLFTMFQELLASELGLPLGTYTHVVGSLHLYERHFDLAQRIIRAPLVPTDEMPAMEQHSQLRTFLDLEARLRSGTHFSPELKRGLHPYWQNLLAVLAWYRYAKDEGGYEKALDSVPLDSPYRTFLSNLAGAPAPNFRHYAKHTAA